MKVQAKRISKVVGYLRAGSGVCIHLSPPAIASLIEVVRGTVELADAHSAVLRLFEDAAPLTDSHPAQPGEIAEAEALESWEERREKEAS